MESRIRLSSMTCVDRRVIDRLAGTISEIDRYLMPQARVYPCGSPMRTIAMDGTRLNALVVVARLRTTGPCKSGCWRPIKSHRARMLIKCQCGSPRNGYLVFIDVRPRGPKARRIIRSTKVLPGVKVGYCPVLFI